MASNRLLKQIIYGAGYLVFLALIVIAVYYIWFKPAPTCFDNIQNGTETGIDCGGSCPSCELKTLVSLDANWVKYFPADNQTAIVAKVNNANLRWAADSFSYTLDIYGTSSDKIQTITGNSFIYSGEIKYIFVLTEIDSKNISNIKVNFSDVNWKMDADFQKPDIQTRGIETTVGQNNSGVIVSGFVTNNNAFDLSKLVIIGLLSNSDGIQINASKTELENTSAFGARQFKINFSKNTSLASSQTQTASSYNFTRDLTIGSKSVDVKRLQEFLKSQGFFDRATTDYFGTVTKNALIQFQKKAAVSPASGYFGSKTRSYINSLKTSTPTTLNLNQADASKTEIYVEAIR